MGVMGLTRTRHLLFTFLLVAFASVYPSKSLVLTLSRMAPTSSPGSFTPAWTQKPWLFRTYSPVSVSTYVIYSKPISNIFEVTDFGLERTTLSSDFLTLISTTGLNIGNTTDMVPQDPTLLNGFIRPTLPSVEP